MKKEGLNDDDSNKTSHQPSLPKSPGPCPGGAFDRNILTEVYQTIVAENPNDVEYVEIWEQCLGKGSVSNSDPEFFADNIHLNKRGCKFRASEVKP